MKTTKAVVWETINRQIEGNSQKMAFLSQSHICLGRVEALDMLSLDNQQLKLLQYI